MSKKDVLGHLLKAFAKDASPTELIEAADTIQEVISEEEGVKGNVTPPPTEGTTLDDAPPPQPPQTQTPPPGGNSELAEIKAMLAQLIQALQPARQQQAPPQNALDSLEAELAQKTEDSEENEESEIKVIEAEDDGELTAPASAPKAMDSGTLLKMIRAVKPVVAQIKDPKERKLTTDALAAFVRQARKQSETASSGGGYAEIMRAAADNAKKSRAATDNAPEDEYGLGRKWAELYNPHYRKAKEAN